MDAAFASHHWPTWGADRIVRFLSEQRDLYAYLHDQTLRMINQGMTGIEIAEAFQLPPRLESAWHARGYYGSVSHNVKAIYQRYMGWFDGNPSSLWEHPPVESATRYVDAIGGQAAVVAKARAYLDADDARFAAQLLKHAVFADPTDDAAKSLLAETYERLGFGAENGPWRNFYLMGAAELRQGIIPGSLAPLGAGIAMALTVEQLFDSLAIRVDGPRAWADHFVIDWHITDLDEHYRMTLSNGVLIHSDHVGGAPADLTLSLTKPQLLGLLAGSGLDAVTHTGDVGVIGRLLSVLDQPDVNFAIVTP